MKKISLVIIVLVLIISAQGCCTVKGFVSGVGKDVDNCWNRITKADTWFKKTAW